MSRRHDEVAAEPRADEEAVARNDTRHDVCDRSFATTEPPEESVPMRRRRERCARPVQLLGCLDATIPAGAQLEDVAGEDRVLAS
jgi:hypothetical protein